MSKKKQILEIEPDGHNKLESFAFWGFKCPYCFGQGSFSHETGKDQYEEEICNFCNGSGEVICSVVVKWFSQSDGNFITKKT